MMELARAKNEAPPVKPRIAAAIALLLVTLAFLARAAAIAEENWDSEGRDQGAYLSIGHAIAEGRAMTDGNRHPLYPAMLAPLAEDDLRYFTRAKLLSVGLSVAGLLIAVALARRFVGTAGALLFGQLLALNNVLQGAAGSVVAEVVLIPLQFALWACCWRALRDEEPVRWSALAGALCGIAHLTKGTATLTLACFVAGGILLGKEGARRIAAFVAVFAFVASPLLIHNVREHGNPFYNVATTHFMWADSFFDGWVDGEEQLPSLGSYVREHSASDAARRVVSGLVGSPSQWFDAVRPGWTLASEVSPGRGAIAFLCLVTVIAAALIPVARRSLPRHRASIVFTLLLGASYSLLFGWYQPVDPSSRFLAPLVPVLLLAFVLALQQLPARGRHLAPALVVMLTAVAAVQLALEWSRVPQLAGMEESDRAANEDTLAVVRAIHDATRDRELVLAGPMTRVPFWLLQGRPTQPVPSALKTPEEFERWVASRGFRAAVVDAGVHRDRHSALENYWSSDGEWLVDRQLPRGWTRVYPATRSCRICVYRIE